MPDMIILAFGLGFGLLLFFKCPYLRGDHGTDPVSQKISVIIPARNEALTLPLILKDLKNQTCPVLEVICVDDQSEDDTGIIAESFGAQLISIKAKPEGWSGKTWACQSGAKVAKGDYLLFLDADVRLSQDAIRKLSSTQAASGCVISVQPFHNLTDIFEQLSFFFNMILIAANGIGLPFFRTNIGLFGPVIMMSKDDYLSIGGYSDASNSIVEDLDLGKILKVHGINYELFLGDGDISFSMYRCGMLQLIEGWAKNFASGALRTPFHLLFMIFIWITACTSAFLHLISSILFLSPPAVALYLIIYLGFALELYYLSRRIGSFKKIAILCYPVMLAAFFIIFAYSVFMKLFRKPVSWKGRKIDLEGTEKCK